MLSMQNEPLSAWQHSPFELLSFRHERVQTLCNSIPLVMSELQSEPQLGGTLHIKPQYSDIELGTDVWGVDSFMSSGNSCANSRNKAIHTSGGICFFLRAANSVLASRVKRQRSAFAAKIFQRGPSCERPGIIDCQLHLSQPYAASLIWRSTLS
jgi:hypothetical protein